MTTNEDKLTTKEGEPTKEDQPTKEVPSTPAEPSGKEAKQPEKAEPKAKAPNKEAEERKPAPPRRPLHGKETRLRGRRRRKVSYLTANKIEKIDYKDVTLLKRFISEQGKMLSSRRTGATARQQRMIARQVRRAREMALLPFVAIDSSRDRRDSGRYRPDSRYRS